MPAARGLLILWLVTSRDPPGERTGLGPCSPGRLLLGAEEPQARLLGGRRVRYLVASEGMESSCLLPCPYTPCQARAVLSPSGVK